MPLLLILVFWLIFWPLARVIALQMEVHFGFEPSRPAKRLLFGLDLLVYLVVAGAIVAARIESNTTSGPITPFSDLAALVIWVPGWLFVRCIALRLDVHRGWDTTGAETKKLLFGIDMFIWFFVAFALVFLRR